MSELLPCPFCGGEAELHPTHDMDTNEVDGWFAWCAMGKDCAIKPQTDAYLTEAEAIAAWNTRAERTCKNDDDDCDAWFKCSECGLHSKLEIMSGGYGIPNYCPNCGAKVVD